MAKYTQQAIMYSLLKLLQEKSIDKITVKDICEDCEINRNTFYYYYRDIYQVIEAFIKTETEQSLNETKAHESFYEEFLQKYHLVLEYRKAVYHLYQSKNRDLILNYFYDITENFVEKYVRREIEGTTLCAEDLKFVIDFYSNTIVGNTIRWLQQGMQDTQEQLIYKLSISYQATVRVLIGQLQKENEKNSDTFQTVPKN